MGKLNQVIAVVAGKKKIALEAITQAYHKIQKADLFSAIARNYQPKDEEGERLPPETKVLQLTVKGLIAEVSPALVEMYDTVYTQDSANRDAAADIVVEDFAIMTGVPVTYLLFLEKQLTDLHTFVSKLPVLDPGESWSWVAENNCFGTNTVETVRTKKLPKAFVKYEATKEHPAQVEMFTEDVVVGYWKTIKFSGALMAVDKAQMLERVQKLREAVVVAREQANSLEVTERHAGQKILSYVFTN